MQKLGAPFRFVPFFGALGALAPLTLGQDAEPHAPAADASSSDATLAVHFAGLDRFLVDARDQGLRRALGMLDERLLDLPDDLGQDFPRPLGELARDLLSSPLTLTLRVLDDPTMMPPVELTIVSGGDAAHARAISERIQMMVEPMLGMEGQTDASGWRVLPAPVPVGYGAMQPGFVVALGTPHAEAPVWDATLPSGVEPVAALRLDLAQVQSLLEAVAANEPDAAEMLQMLETFGLFGPTPLGFTWVVGHGADRAHHAGRARNWVPYARNTGAYVAEPLTAAELRILPADATLATLQKMDPTYLLGIIERLAALEGGVDPTAMVKEMTGLDLHADLFDHLGTTLGFYMSESSGGGGFASFTFLVAVRDEEALLQTLTSVGGMLADIAAANADGRFVLREWEHAGTRCFSTSFPGVPVPLELSFAVSRGFLVKTITPQALVSALDRLASDGPGLASTALFQDNAPGSVEGLQALSFTNTPASLRDGYALTAFLCSALANAVRTPADYPGPAREPGMILPTYAELAAGARPTVTLARIVGDDLVMAGQSDRSVLASVAGTVGNSWFTAIFAASAVSGLAMPLAAQRAEASRASAEAQEARTEELQRMLEELEREMGEAEDEMPEDDGEDG
jgi:hypothetical protein